MSKPFAAISLDLDNTWSYLKIRGCKEWETYPTHFPKFIPLILDFLDEHDQKITFFIVGKDAEIDSNTQWLQEISNRGHEVGNHSFNHEPWMEQRTEEEVYSELMQAHNAIEKATGKQPVGFRGPGFCHSPEMLRAVKRMNYPFDASVLPTSIAPIARLYYFWKMDKVKQEKRENLFGNFSAAFLPNRPFHWEESSGGVYEIPVSTIPIIRTPFHLSYLLWLSQFSETLAMGYLKMAIHLCKLYKISPSFLLHPPDFFGGEDVPALSFFPGMNLSQKTKVAFAHKVMHELKAHFDLIPMSQLPKPLIS